MDAPYVLMDSNITSSVAPPLKPKSWSRRKPCASLSDTSRRMLTHSRAAQIMQAIYKKCLNGDLKAIELLAKFVGELDNKQAPTVAIQLNGFSDPILIQKAKEYAKLNYDSSNNIVDATVVVETSPSGSLAGTA